MLPFGGNFTEALGTELDLQGFATALDTIVHEHEQSILAALRALNPELEDAFFQIRGQVHGTGDTDGHTGIVTGDKLDFHGKGSFHGILVREHRFGVLARVLVGISTAAGNGFAHHDADHILVGTERFTFFGDKTGLVTVAVVAETVAGKRRRSEK